MTETKFAEMFGEFRIVGLAGDKNSGKTNNLMALVKDFRLKNKKVPIFVYGLDDVTTEWIKKLGNIFEISSIEQLSSKNTSLIIIDEFQKLKLNDRRYKEDLDAFIDFIYHNNNWVILSSPNIREFNSVIGSKIERWALKNLRFNDIINGSHLKDAVSNYNGKYKVLSNLEIPKNKILIINKDYEKELEIEYLKEIDSKEKNENIFK